MNKKVFLTGLRSGGSTSTLAGLMTEISPQDKQDNMVVPLFSQLTRLPIES